MILIAIVGLALGIAVQGGRWYYFSDESVRSPMRFLIVVFVGYVLVFGAILAPLYIFDAIQDERARRRIALAKRMAELDRASALKVIPTHH